jgi:PAS domain S-box-containing protein
MSYQLLYLLGSLLGSAVTIIATYYVWKRRSAPGALPFFLTLFANANREMFHVLEIAVQNVVMMQYINIIRFSFAIFMPYTILLFALSHSERHRWLTPRYLIIAAIIPSITMVLNWTNFYHHLVWADYGVYQWGIYLSPIHIRGAWFPIYYLYCFLFILSAIIILVHTALVFRNPYRFQAIFIIFSTFIIVLLEFFLDTVVDVTPLVQSFTSAALVWVLFHHRLFDLTPVAHHTLVSNMPDGMIILDIQHRIVDINPAAQALAAVSPSRVVGQEGATVIPGWEEWNYRLIPTTYGKTTASLCSFSSTSSLHATYHHEKTDRYYDVQITPLRSRSNQLTGWMVIFRDITEHKQVEEQLRQAQQDAEAANEAKSAFLANMSHELRTPLNAILGFSRLMLRDSTIPDETRATYLQTILHSGEHLLKLINDVLNMAKIEAGKIIRQDDVFDLYHLLDEIEMIFQVSAKQKQLLLAVTCDANVPRYISTDETKLRQVLLNLISNAIKFTEEGCVALRVQPNQPTTSGGKTSYELRFEVEDSGPGIAEDEQYLLFKPFAQTRTGQQSLEGTGLGLAISQGFVQLLGGMLEVKSTPNIGTSFFFTITVPMVEQQEYGLSGQSSQVIALTPGQKVPRTLIVDDQWSNRQLLVNLLQPLGFAVREAEHGQEAVEVWEKWPADLILMDIRMPIMDGYKATRAIRAMEGGTTPTIIAITASVADDRLSSITDAGCDAVILKPFREQELFEYIHRLMGLSFVYGTTDSTPPLPQTAPVVEAAEEIATYPIEQMRLLPPDLLESLRFNALLGDTIAVEEIIQTISLHNEALAQVLKQWAENFDYERMLHIIEETSCTIGMDKK